MADPSLVRHFKGHRGPVTAYALFSNISMWQICDRGARQCRKHFAFEGSSITHHPATFAAVWCLPSSRSDLCSASMNPNMKQIATSSLDGTVMVWNLKANVSPSVVVRRT